MKNISRQHLRKILMEEVLNASEMAQFSGSKSGRAVKKAGAKIMTAGKSIRDIAEDQTGKMRATLGSLSEFVYKMGSALERMDHLEEGETVAENLPTVQELKKLYKEIQSLEKGGKKE
jgi:hypothetical protein